MVEKHRRKKRKFGETALLLTTFDCALMNERNCKTGMSVVSFSSQLFSHQMTNSISTAISGKKLKWQQLLCDETPETILPAVQQHYVEKKKKRLERGLMFSLMDVKL